VFVYLRRKDHFSSETDTEYSNIKPDEYSDMDLHSAI
jgi:hypothetical protein